MKKLSNILFVTMAISSLLCGGCKNLWGGIITVTQVRESTLRELAQLHKRGLISPATDTKIEIADNIYLKAAESAQVALVAYKQGTATEADYLAKLTAVKNAVSALIDILTPLVTSQESNKLKADLSAASKL